MVLFSAFTGIWIMSPNLIFSLLPYFSERIWWHEFSGREMFLNPWYSGQQQQQPPSNTSNNSAAAEENSSLPVSGTENTSNGGPPGININNQHLSAALQGSARSSPAASPRLPPRSSPRPGLDNRNQQADLEEVQRRLRSGWTVHTTADGRYYYCK